MTLCGFAYKTSLARDEQASQARQPEVSSSRVPAKCATCHRYASADALGRCTQCGTPFHAVALRGMERAG